MQSLFLDDKGQFNGQVRYFWAANEMLEDSLREARLLWVLKEDILDPTKPTLAYNNLAAGEATSADYHCIDRYEDKVLAHHEKYERAYQIVLNFLGPTTLACVKHIIHDDDLNLRKKSQQIMKHLKDTLGKMSSHDVIRIEADIAALPLAVDDISAARLVDELIEYKAIMDKSGRPLSDGYLLQKLISKLSGAAFIRVYEEIDNDEAMSFDNACKKLRSAIQTYQRIQNISSSSTTSTKRKFDNIQEPEYVAQNSLNGEQLVTSINPESRDIKKNSSQRHWPKCWNCNNSGHFASQCNAPYCGKCKKIFSSINDSNYHNATNCPQNKPSFRNGKNRFPEFRI
jgi:hypothetical protein